jgi:hypothetical protein
MILIHSLPNLLQKTENTLAKNPTSYFICSMNKIATLIFALSVLIATESCRKKGVNPLGGLTPEMLKDSSRVEFPEATYEFGTIQQGDTVVHLFPYKNVGDKNLIIANAFGSCGCTVPEYPRQPIAPGATDTIRVKFNSAGKEGKQNKSVTLMMNTAKRAEMIYLTGTVEVKK